MDAINAPVRRTRKEVHTSDTQLGQLDNIQMPDEGLPERGDTITPIDTPMHSEHTTALLFAEEPVTIFINKGSEKFAPLTVDCWVNGKGAEVMTDKGWAEFGWLPVERTVTTKRKYVEVLARSRHMSVQTNVGQVGDEHPRNEISRSNSLKAQFSVLKDASPMGPAWLQRILSEQV